MAVPYTFGSATSSIPLSYLDTNFATPITLGNTAVYLGNTTTSIGNLTLTNVTISSGSANVTYGNANAVVYTNTSNVGITSTALTFDGTNLGVGTSSPAYPLDVVASSGSFGISLRGRSSDNIGTLGFFTNNGATNDVQLQMRPSDNEFRILVSGARSQTFYTNGSERMRLDSSGNLGLGVTPSAWDTSIFTTMQIRYASFFSGISSPGDTWVGQNLYYGSGAYRYIANGYSSYYRQSQSEHQWGTSASGVTGNAITFTQAMTLNASGNLLLGSTSSPATVWSGSRTFAYVKGSTAGNGGEVIVESNNGNQQASFFASAITAEFGLWSTKASAILFGNSNTERARIDSSGKFLVGTTSGGSDKVRFGSAGASENQLGLISTDNSDGNGFIQFRKADVTSIGSVSRVGTTNAVVYNTTSDYRLKNVTGAVTGQGARIDALKPIDYLWKEGGQQARGFLAHEFQTVYPNSVTGDKDAVDADGNPKYQSMQAATSEVIADLVAEIQLLRKRLADAGL
jgi:hypothetical protein